MNNHTHTHTVPILIRLAICPSQYSPDSLEAGKGHVTQIYSVRHNQNINIDSGKAFGFLMSTHGTTVLQP